MVPVKVMFSQQFLMKTESKTQESIHGQTEEQHAVETITKEFHSDQQVNTEP